MRQYLKSNSILIGVDMPSDSYENRRGISFIGLQDAFGFSVDVPRSAEKQIGSQSFAVNAVSFAPDISFELSFVPTRKFDTENVLGLNFGFNPTFESVFLGKSDVCFNVYLFISNKQSYDFIKQLRDSQSLNGVECIALGSCFLNSYGFSMNVSDLARANASLVASNMEASVIQDNKVRIPQIDFQTGAKFGDASLELDWLQIETALDEIELINQPILPTTQVKFNLTNSNLDVPSAIISPLSDAKIQSLEFSVNIPRETSYGFSSNFPYGRKIKYPVEGQLNVSTIFSAVNSGSFTGLMGTENKHNVRLDFIDPQELFLSGLSFSELSGYFATGVSGATGAFTNSRSLFISGAKLSNWRQDFPINGFSTFQAGMTFQCTESGGLLSQYGMNGGSQPYWMYSSDARKLFDGSGNLMVHDNYLYIYGEDCELNYLVDGDGNLMLADNWSEEANSCPYVSPPSPAPDIFSLLDSGLEVTIQWNSSSDTNYYDIEISEDGSSYSSVGTTTSTIYLDASFSRGNDSFYFYRVTAYGDGGSTQGSAESIRIP